MAFEKFMAGIWGRFLRLALGIVVIAVALLGMSGIAAWIFGLAGAALVVAGVANLLLLGPLFGAPFDGGRLAGSA